MVPGASLERGGLRHLLVSFGRCTNEDDITLTARDDEVTRRQQHLAVPVAAGLPLPVAAGGIDTREDPLVDPVDEAVVVDRAREAVLHPARSPDLACGHPVTIAG